MIKNKNLKVLWLAPIPLIDNADSHPAPWVMTLAKAMVSNGIDLAIINYNSKIKDKVVIRSFEGIEMIYIKTPKLKLDFITFYSLRIRIVRKYLKKHISNFDILHIHGTEHQYEAMSNDLNIPKVISIQGIINEYINYLPILEYKIFLEWKLSAIYESFYLKKNVNFSCRTKWDSSYVLSKVPKANIYMIWEMIRKEYFSNHFSILKKNILFVGGSNPIKGLKELLISYNNSIQDLELKLIILGNCSIDHIKKIVKENQLSKIKIENIDCRGMQDSKGMVKAFDESFCLVHPTYIDNSPNSVCEAQLSGLPVIATDVGGVSSLIDNEKTGLLIKNTIEELEYAVNKLYLNDDLRKKISKTARIAARERHSSEKIINQTLLMYKEIIHNYKNHV